MKRMTFVKKILLVVVSIISFGYLTVAAEASPITYQFTSTSAFGDVDGATFNNVNFMISILGDTNNVDTTTPGSPFLDLLTGTINIFGGDLTTPYVGTFTDTLYVFVDQSNEIVGFGGNLPDPDPTNPPNPTDLLSLTIPGVGLGSYDLKSNFGPVTAGLLGGTGLVFDQFGGIGTSFGTLTFDNIDNATFTAVPEPSTMVLLASGLVGLVGFRKKFRISKES